MLVASCALVEEAVFGRRYSYTNDLTQQKGDEDAYRNDLIKIASDRERTILKKYLNTTLSEIYKKTKFLVVMMDIRY